MPVTIGDDHLFALLRADRHLLLGLTGVGRLAGLGRPGPHVHSGAPLLPPADPNTPDYQF